MPGTINITVPQTLLFEVRRGCTRQTKFWASPNILQLQGSLRGLSLFLKMFPIFNTGVSAAYILATIYPKLGSLEHYFYQFAYRDSKVPKHFVGLIQMQCSPSFGCNKDKQNVSTACLLQLYPPDCVGGVTETPNCMGGEGAVLLSNPPLTGEHPPLKHPTYLLFRSKGGRKIINFCSHFYGLLPDNSALSW